MVLFTLNSNCSFAEQQEQWQRFKDEKSDLYGFKNINHEIMISPKFIMVDAHKFKNIIAVIEQIDKENFQSYYLLKNREKVGLDSLYMQGNYLDCENEEKIRFRDKKLDKVGFFNKNGKKVIPAVYSDAEPFRNNMAIVLKAAQRVCHDGTKYSPEKGNCEHFRWDGGRSYLINSENKILINDFKHTRDLDWFSLRITEKKLDNPLRESFKGTNQKYYSFVNFEKEFTHWLESKFLLSDDLKALKANSFQKITFWNSDKNQWNSANKDLFLNNNLKTILKIIKELKSLKLKYAIHENSTGVMSSSSDDDLYSNYFDSCSNPKTWKYPLFDIVINHYSKDSKKEVLYQDIIEFLKTVDGYRLINFSLKSVELK